MSRRNSREAKVRRRAERAAHRSRAADPPTAEFHEYSEVLDLAMRGERMPCGCDAHELLHEFISDLAPPEIR